MLLVVASYPVTSLSLQNHQQHLTMLRFLLILLALSNGYIITRENDTFDGVGDNFFIENENYQENGVKPANTIEYDAVAMCIENAIIFTETMRNSHKIATPAPAGVPNARDIRYATFPLYTVALIILTSLCLTLVFIGIRS